MNDHLIQIIRQHSQPLTAQPTTAEPRLQRLTNVRAVLFDIYGTMLISGSGEVGTVAVDVPDAFRLALQAVDIDTEKLPGELGLEPTIREHHERMRARGIDYPEVDIREVWRDALSDLVQQGSLTVDVDRVDISRISVEYECRVNPVWPMPHVESCVGSLGQRVLGIVSNAQFFTPLLFPALLLRTLDEMRFSPDMQYFSYVSGVAKPSPKLFQEAVESLGHRGIDATDTLYVGNDMLNDVATASHVGMKTALFAGDQRSLRTRDGDPRIGDCRPDLILTDLKQLNECIS